MIRWRYTLVLLPLLLAGCGPSGQPRALFVSPQRSVGAANFTAAAIEAPDAPAPVNAGQLFSYNHSLDMVMPQASVQPRYQRALARCEHDAALHCMLVEASLNKSDDGTSATFTVAMPHDAIATYEHALQAPVAGEKDGDAKLRASSTSASNVTQESGDAGRKVAQLKDYRDRLAALANHKDLSVDDLIKAASELSTAQSALDDATSAQQDVNDRVARERLTVSLAERAAAPGGFDPIAQVWHSSMELLAQSTADVLQFLIQILPWLPVTIGGLFLLRWLWRIAQRRPAVAQSRPDKTSGD
ncbi:MAG TPA: DUF4349 domain-containing protein [Rhizomicrobium sp.]|jgi:hypothetical protein